MTTQDVEDALRSAKETLADIHPTNSVMEGHISDALDAIRMALKTLNL